MSISILVDSASNPVEVEEESTLGITVSFLDDDGNAETPTSATWTLTDTDGTVINSREQQNIGSLASSVTITLSGNDLAIQSGETTELVLRRFLVEAVYDSDLGSDLPMKKSVAFAIQNLKYVT